MQLDQNVWQKPDVRVLDAVEAAAQLGGNPSSSHQLGQGARRRLEIARSEILRWCGIHADTPERLRPFDIIFCGGPAEAQALGVFGAALVERKRRGATVIVCVDGLVLPTHIARLAQMLQLHLIVATSPEAISKNILLKKSLAVVALPCLHQDYGTPGAFETWSAFARLHGARLHLDTSAAGSRGCSVVSTDLEGVTSVALMSAPIGGPAGVCALVLRRGAVVVPLWRGGGQEGGLRSGTPATALCVGLGRAAQLAQKKQATALTDVAAMAYVRERCEVAIARLNGWQAGHHPMAVANAMWLKGPKPAMWHAEQLNLCGIEVGLFADNSAMRLGLPQECVASDAAEHTIKRLAEALIEKP